MDVTTFTAIAAGIGLPTLLLAGVNGLIGWLKGYGERDKRQYREMLEWKDYALRLWEIAHVLRLKALAGGIDKEDLEDIPKPPLTFDITPPSEK